MVLDNTEVLSLSRKLSIGKIMGSCERFTSAISIATAAAVAVASAGAVRLATCDTSAALSAGINSTAVLLSELDIEGGAGCVRIEKLS